MLDVLEVQDQLKNFSQEQLLREMQMPTGNVPQFLVLSELNRRRTMSQDLAKRQSADQPTVKEEVVASSGMPMEKASMMAQQMAPKTSMTENTGIASMMPRELPSEEEPMKMSYGGLINSRAMGMAAPLARGFMERPGLGTRQVTDMRYRPLPNERLNIRRYSGGLGGLGSDIMGRVSEKSRADVDSFLGEVEDIKYFQKKLYKSLNVPVSRLEAEGSFNMGRATEINRDELKFSKFVDRLRTRFNNLFHDLLKTQLILKGIVTIEDWENSLARTIRYNYVNDGYYAEIKESEMFKERMEIYRNLKDSEMIGNIYSKEWAMKNVLKMTDIDIQDEKSKIEKEQEAEAPPEGEDDDTGQF